MNNFSFLSVNYLTFFGGKKSLLEPLLLLCVGLDDRGSRVRFPAVVENFSLHHRVQNGSGAHPASYPMGTRGSFPVGKAAEA
jgi:hypothetical protein